MTDALGPYELGKVHCADCVEAMRALPEASVDAVVTDPPYGLEFMGKEWDKLGATVEHPDDGEGPWGRTARVRFGATAASMQAWHEAWAREALRVLKPGGHLLAFGGTRTYHRLTCAIEDAGFEIRDCLSWLYGSGFPKSLDVSKAIDKAAGIEPEGYDPNPAERPGNGLDATTSTGWAKPSRPPKPRATSEDAKRWSGWSTALKPAWEPVVLARKPLAGTVAANVLAHGTGALNVDGCRIGTGERTYVGMSPKSVDGVFRDDKWEPKDITRTVSGRWPANLILDPEAAAMLDAQSGRTEGRGPYTQPRPTSDNGGASWSKGDHLPFHIGDSGGASRFFYCAKASRGEREAGLVALAAGTREDVTGRERESAGANHPRSGIQASGAIRNLHPTVKPIALMRWLVRLVTPPGGIVLDPFAGSGTTGCACAFEGARFLGFEKEAEYVEIANARIAQWTETARRTRFKEKRGDAPKTLKRARRKIRRRKRG